MVICYHIIGFVDKSTCITAKNKNDTIVTLKEKYVRMLNYGMIYYGSQKVNLNYQNLDTT